MRLLGKGVLRLLPNSSHFCGGGLRMATVSPAKCYIDAKLQFCTEPAIPQNRVVPSLFFFVRYIVGQFCYCWKLHGPFAVWFCVSVCATWRNVWFRVVLIIKCQSYSKTHITVVMRSET